MPAALLATCAAPPDGNEDGAPPVNAHAQHGTAARWVAWTELEIGAAAIGAVGDRFGADQRYARVDLLPAAIAERA
ncbi:MAG TPA: hypothetical protein VIH10_20535 [Kribbella sp.]|jgi:hypothetical protein|nr:hypothetical protein [Gaiellales bacterium]